MIIKKTKFKDLLVIKQKNNKDSRGNLRETFNNKVLNKKAESKNLYFIVIDLSVFKFIKC